MPREAKQNLHVPLPAGLYRRLRAEAQRTRRPATALAREAIDRWLEEARKAALFTEISSYAREVAGTDQDLDERLEVAGVENLLAMAKRERPGRRKRG